MALGRIYVKEHFPPEAKKRADELVKNLLAALADDLQTLSWMSESTKKAAADEGRGLRPQDRLPGQVARLLGLSVSRASYAANVERRDASSSVQRDLAKIGKPVGPSTTGA